MATGNVIVTVIDVGQGQCTFVEIYDDAKPTPKLTNALLFDCGSDKESTDTSENLKYVARKVSTMTTPVFDCLVFSHSDKDHVSLMKELLGYFAKTSPPTPQIKLVWYGGNRDQYKKRKTNILDYLVTNGYCTENEIKTTGANYSGYNPKTGKYTHGLWQSPDKSVTLVPIVSNVLKAEPDWDTHPKVLPQKSAESRNRISIVAGLYYGGASYVICGDATNITMAATNVRFKDTTVFDKNIMTTLPHHGSRTTGFAVKSGKKASDTAKGVVITFAALMKSKTITVSAYAKHSHPSLELMIDFAPGGTPILKDPRLNQKNAHRVTANIDKDLMTKPKKSDDPPPTKKSKVSGVTFRLNEDQSCETDTNIFTTNYYRSAEKTFSFKIKFGSEPTESDGVISPTPTIDPFACWKYIAKNDGSYTVEGYPGLRVGAVSFTQAVTTNTELKKPADEKKKAPALPAVGKPVNIRSEFRSRLKQFR